MSYNVLIIGASARAAAMSAVRAGHEPWCADQFADQDLARICTVERIETGGAGLESLIRTLDAMPSTPWFFTGGLENYPEIVERISRRHRLWGVGAVALKEVRDPERVVAILRAAGIACPGVSSNCVEVPRDGSWLSKPVRSGGGIGIDAYSGQAHSDDSPRYYQQRIQGKSYSALYLGTRSGTHLIGVSRQLMGVERAPFVYRGSIGPVPVTEATRQQLERLGTCLTLGCGLAGWFGVDFVSDGEMIWPVEVNPRYTASVEIHEFALRQALLPLHIRACEERGASKIESLQGNRRHAARTVGKCVLYATRDVQVGHGWWTVEDADDPFAIPTIADIPVAGSRFRQGDPVLSVLAEGVGFEDCQSQLLARELEWRRRLKLDE